MQRKDRLMSALDIFYDMHGIAERYGTYFTDILKHWSNCWTEALFAGIIFMAAGRKAACLIEHQKPSRFLLFSDGLFLYYLLYVTLLSRPIGFRREVELLPFTNPKLMNGEFHYVIENILLLSHLGFYYTRRCMHMVESAV